ncbi:hypothetical protein EL17_22175 [Anditalea andensis]|uniref:Uncharacterized protein n=1 Tax=Anditalea andensis TaxID=1048983 RepID=A0A074L5I5_9BACT|nr:hypothetical protein EL17_22175 [Anditalea andensis]
MDQKRIFGPLLTILGIIGLIYAAFLFLDDTNVDWKTQVVFFILGLIFFSSGLGLIKNTNN